MKTHCLHHIYVFSLNCRQVKKYSITVLCLFLAIAYGHAVLAKSQAKPPRVIDLTHRLEDNIATYFVDPNQQ